MVANPKGCGCDESIMRRESGHKTAGEKLVNEVLGAQGPAILKVGLDLHGRTFSPIGADGHLDGCPDPFVVAGMLRDEWDQNLSPLPEGLTRQLEQGPREVRID
jgi:hypothetical protein